MIVAHLSSTNLWNKDGVCFLQNNIKQLFPWIQPNLSFFLKTLFTRLFSSVFVWVFSLFWSNYGAALCQVPGCENPQSLSSIKGLIPFGSSLQAFPSSHSGNYFARQRVKDWQARDWGRDELTLSAFSRSSLFHCACLHVRSPQSARTSVSPKWVPSSSPRR